MTISALRVHRERLQRLFAQVEEAHHACEDVEMCTVEEGTEFDELETRYLMESATLDERRRELIRAETAEVTRQANLNQPNANEAILNQRPTAPLPPVPQVIRVETMRQPEVGLFDGSPANWPAFRDLFIAEVHNREMDKVTKLIHLQKACVGKAATTLGPWQPTADNYTAAWEAMLTAYNDDYHVIHGIIGRMYAVPKHDKETYDSLRLVVDTMNGSTRQLESIAEPKVLWDQMWIHLAKQRLPKYTLDAWEQFRNRNGGSQMPTLETFRQFLDTKAKGRREFEQEEVTSQKSNFAKSKHEAGGHRFRPYDRQNNSRYSNSAPKPGASTSFGPTKCLMTGCELVHYLGQCELFRKLTLEERIAFMGKHRLCRCCLQAGHMATTCRYATCAKCPDSAYKHHFRLCKKQNDAATKPENPFRK